MTVIAPAIQGDLSQQLFWKWNLTAPLSQTDLSLRRIMLMVKCVKMISLFKQVRSIGNEIPHAEIRENGDRQKRDRALYVSDLLKQRDLIVFLSFDA